MKRILIFSGTTEGRELAESLRDTKAEVIVSVATEYGKECMNIEESSNIIVHAGRMNEAQICQFIRENRIGFVADATHPFALEVTKNVEQACKKTDTEYVRCVREWQNWEEGDVRVIRVDSVAQAVEKLQNTTGNILISTGSKELFEYTRLSDYQQRCYARVLSTQRSVEESIRLGFEGRHLIAMQGPFSKELNLAMLNDLSARYFVTKESGKSGGFLEKVEAAKEAGAVLIVIGRPIESGKTPKETKKIIEKGVRLG